MSGDAEAVQLGAMKPTCTAVAHAHAQGSSVSTAGGAGAGSSAEKQQQQQQQQGILEVTTAPGGASASPVNPPAADNGGGGGGGRSAGPAALSQSARVVSSGSNNPPTPSKPQQQAVTVTAANDATGDEQPRQAFEKPRQLGFIATPHDNDVLCGRGGGTNHHPGNKQYRKLVEERRLEYVNSSKRGKPLLSRSIVEAVRNQSPPGRFLAKDDKAGLWYDIGDQKAREKTAQALREGAPDIRKEIGQPYVHAIVPGESLKAVLSEQDLPHAITVGHHSPPQMGGDNDDGNDDSSSNPSKTLASMKTDTVGKLKRPKSLGSGGGGKRVASAPMVMGNSTAGILGSSGVLPSHAHAQTAYYGSSSRGGKRSTSVPQQMQYGTPATYPRHGHHFHEYPPHTYQHAQYHSHQQQYSHPRQQPFPATAAAQQWVAGGTGTAPTGPSPTSMGTGVATATAGTASGHAVSDDVARRLLLSEWIAGGKIDGQELELQRKIEAEADAYRTAGLMGIDPDELTKRLEGGREDIVSIVESHRAKVMDAAEKSAAAGDGPSHFKKRKLNGDGTGNEMSETRKRINEALRSMGAF